ncbi:hypothetical protein, partial [Clostridium perfringens]
MLKSILTRHHNRLNYPNSTSGCYSASGFRAIWFDTREASERRNSALQLLDCVLQYGLKKNYFHPDFVSFGNWANIEKKERNLE